MKSKSSYADVLPGFFLSYFIRIKTGSTPTQKTPETKTKHKLRRNPDPEKTT